MKLKLSFKEKFVLIVQASTKKEALLLAGNNQKLREIINYLEREYHFYKKNTN